MMKLNSIFTSNMVLQANKPIRFFGTGKGIAKIEFLGQIAVCENDKEDAWVCEFAPTAYGGPYSVVVSLNDNKVILQDVYIGEVVLLAGQSNLQMTVAESNATDEELVSNDNIRCYAVDRPEDFDKTRYVISQDGWQICQKDKLYKWSALGYYVGKYLSEGISSKIGLIFCAQGASAIEGWIDKEVFSSYQDIQIPLENKHIDHRILAYSWNKNGVLYDYMIKKIIPYSVASIVWYQGESDTTESEGKIYDKELEILIDLWRNSFNDRKLKFIIVQLADYQDRSDEGWRSIQKAQERASKRISNVILVKSADVCECDSIHPLTKSLLGKRIAEALGK